MPSLSPNSAPLRWPLLLLCLGLGTACQPSPTTLDMSTPKATAESLGRFICAEHINHMRTAKAALRTALRLQESKATLFTDPRPAQRTLDRLRELDLLFSQNAQELLACNVVIVDQDIDAKGNTAQVAIDIVTNRWAAEANQAPTLVRHTWTLVIHLRRANDQWKIVHASEDVFGPDLNLRRLLN